MTSVDFMQTQRNPPAKPNLLTNATIVEQLSHHYGTELRGVQLVINIIVIYEQTECMYNKKRIR